jgi:hypothetical protein
MRWLVVACVLAGCHPYIAGGVTPAWKMKGALASAVSEPVARTSAPATTTMTTTSTAPTNAYEAEVGSSYYDFFLGVNVQAHNLTSSLPAFAGGSMADGTPQYLNAIASLDIAWAWLHWKWVSSYIHAGPAGAVLYDRSGGSQRLGLWLSLWRRHIGELGAAQHLRGSVQDGPRVRRRPGDGIQQRDRPDSGHRIPSLVCS